MPFLSFDAECMGSPVTIKKVNKEVQKIGIFKYRVRNIVFEGTEASWSST